MHKPKTPARPSVPFTLPLLPPTQAGRAVTDISLFDPPAPAASAHPLRISLQSLLVSLLPRSPPPSRRRLTGACQEPERTDRRRQAGDPVCGGARWSPAFDCKRRKETLTTLLQYYKQFHAVTK